jgi:hypothetical protein
MDLPGVQRLLYTLGMKSVIHERPVLTNPSPSATSHSAELAVLERV